MFKHNRNSFFPGWLFIIRFIPDSILTLVSIPEPNPGFAEIASSGGRYVIGAGLITMIIGLIQMLSNLSNPSGIGIGMSIAMLSALYAIIASEIFFAFWHKSYSGKNNPQPDTPVSLRNIGLCFAVMVYMLALFGILLISFD